MIALVSAVTMNAASAFPFAPIPEKRVVARSISGRSTLGICCLAAAEMKLPMLCLTSGFSGSMFAAASQCLIASEYFRILDFANSGIIEDRDVVG